MGNKSSSLYKTAQETKWLDLHDCKIKQLPQEILPAFELRDSGSSDSSASTIASQSSSRSQDSKKDLGPLVTKIEGVCLSDNPIVLNDDLARLNSLEFLDLSHCNLLTLHRSIAALPHLKELVLARNSLSTIPHLPHSLEKLDISFNMIINIPEQLSQLPNLYYVNLEGNPCAKRVKNLILKGRARSGRILGKEITFEKLRFNYEEVETLAQVFESMVDVTTGLISLNSFKQRMGLVKVSDTTFVDSLFRVFEKFGSKDEFDARAFLLGLGVVFKGTVEEKLKFCFDLFDLDYDGFIEVQDIIDVTKSSMISAIHLAEFCREEYEQESVNIKIKELDFSLRMGNRSVHHIRSKVGDTDKMVEEVYDQQWHSLKEVTVKRFKEMDRSGKGKVSLHDFTRASFPRFAEVNQFIMFYGSILSYGHDIRF